ncbi:MAG: chemotaxis protein [Eubacteriales bacterium]|nr:chemotaxis protein [Eubacteriales bacterium]
MTKSKANAQTRATEKYRQKKGIVTKSFKLKKTLKDEFEKTCMRLDVSQTETLIKLMQQFIDENKET